MIICNIIHHLPSTHTDLTVAGYSMKHTGYDDYDDDDYDDDDDIAW